MPSSATAAATAVATAKKDDLSDRLNGLSLQAKKRVDENSARLQKELNRCGFRIFECIADHGYFSWDPPHKAPYKSMGNIRDVDDLNLEEYLDLKGTPDELIDVTRVRTPQSFFKYLPPVEQRNDYPHSKLDIVCLHVAVKHRGVKLEEVDFIFGGSTLEMLANCDATDPYLVTTVGTEGGSKAILIVKAKDYVKNLSDLGFQFERLMTGRPMEDAQSDTTTVEHLQEMNVGPYRVLFRAETDAISKTSGTSAPVEIKASNPRYWGTKVMFQMISSGSLHLCHGEKGRGLLTRVRLQSLQQVAKTALMHSGIQTLESNISNNMESIITKMEDAALGDVFKIAFRGRSLQLLPMRGRSTNLLPPQDVVEAMIGN